VTTVFIEAWREEINMRIFWGVENMQVSLCAENFHAKFKQVSFNICVYAASSSRVIFCDATASSYRPRTAMMHVFVVKCVVCVSM